MTHKDQPFPHAGDAQDPDPEAVARVFREGIYPYDKKIKRSDYEMRKGLLQVELLKVQNWVKLTGQRVVALFEGRDAAGKGGTIKRFMEHLNPRVPPTSWPWRSRRRSEARAVVLPALRLPPADASGEIVLFDRSWYNRAGVERVMNFCDSEASTSNFMRQVPKSRAHARATAASLLFKYWFSVTRKEQERRFQSREGDPLKRWKLSPVDRESRSKWDEYTEAKKAMFFYTDTADSPWTVIKSDDKKRARLNCMVHFLDALDYPEKDTDLVRPPDPLIVGVPRQILGSEGAD